MSENRLIPWNWARHPEDDKAPEVFGDLRRQVDRVFDQAWRGIAHAPPWAWGEIRPRAEVSETDKELRVAMELPGMALEDLEVLVAEDRLTVKGEKRAAKEEKGRSYHMVERSYGAFERSFRMPSEVEPDRTEASFKDGVLTVVVPKTAKAKEAVKKVLVKTAKTAMKAAPAKKAAPRKAAPRKAAPGKATVQ
jgi:HSP20 family protein